MKHNQQHPEIPLNPNVHQSVKHGTRAAGHKQKTTTPKYIYEIMREEDEEMASMREAVREEVSAHRYKTPNEA